MCQFSNLEELIDEKEYLEKLNDILRKQVKRLEQEVESQKEIIKILTAHKMK